LNKKLYLVCKTRQLHEAHFYSPSKAACFVIKFGCLISICWESENYGWDIIKLQQLTIKLLMVVEGRGHWIRQALSTHSPSGVMDEPARAMLYTDI